MGLKVVAEGYGILKRYGCDMAQGYFISRPLPSAELLAWMKESPWGIPTASPPSARVLRTE